ncbi:MAG TPA: hypothetical protein VMR74_14235 [Gammaproteobacteria bacterium]|nr:hypothetical protein [Gammaproteobacteria bacterium]
MSQLSGTTERGDSTTDRLATMAHETIDRVTPKANRAETEMRDTAARTAEGVKNLEEHAMDTAKDGLHKAQAYIQENPLMAAGIALGAGALLSMLLRR